MGYGSISGHAITNPDAPRAFGVCDRCARWFNHENLRWQFDYRGRSLQNIRILVCEDCEDDPQPQLKPRIIPPDPLPIMNARVEPFCQDEEDDRTTQNPALPNVDYATTTQTVLSGYQFVDGVQVTDGALVLVANQTNPAQNGIYKVTSAVWPLMAFNNETRTWFDAGKAGVTTYGQLGYYDGAVNVALGATQSAKLFQINFENPNETLVNGTPVTVSLVAAALVDHYDFFTGIFMEAGDTRITQLGDDRTTQQTGQPIGGNNLYPGTNYLVPGDAVLGIPDEVPYGCGTSQGLPPGFEQIPKSGELSPYEIVGNWVNNDGERCVFVTEDPHHPGEYIGIGGWFTYLYGPFEYLVGWGNNRGQICVWGGVGHTGIVEWGSPTPPRNIRG